MTNAFLRTPHHASYVFNQSGTGLYRNQPRFAFQYYIDINLNNVGTASEFIALFYNSPTLSQVMPLVKSIDMPSMKIETNSLNQYNRHRISQKKISFESVKMVFHDVADGKTLKFWEMYYRYYFADGNEPGVNVAKIPAQQFSTYATEELVNSTTQGNALPTSVTTSYQTSQTVPTSPTNTLGDKSKLQNIISNSLDNHNFGYNLQQVGNVRNLIQSIDIYQTHGGRFNKVTLVNPRIASFSHDTLNYAESGKTLEVTMTLEYEYAYYTIQNLRIGGKEINNTSSLEPLSHGDFLETKSTFNAALVDFMESGNPVLTSDLAVGAEPGGMADTAQDMQSTLGDVFSAAGSRLPAMPGELSNMVATGTSALGGIIDVAQPLPQIQDIGITAVQPFASTARTTAVTSVLNSEAGVAAQSMYSDVNRIKGLF